MTIQPPLPRREAMFMTRPVDRPVWQPLIEVDPIYVPVEVSAHGLMADPYDSALRKTMDAVLMEVSQTDLRLVWTDGEANVLGMCPGCDKPFPVADGVVTLQSITCGC